MRERNIVLEEHFDRFVEASVASGRFRNASEVVTEALRLLETREQEDARRCEALRQAARIGFEDLDQGRSRVVGDEELEGYVAELGERAAQRVRRGRDSIG